MRTHLPNEARAMLALLAGDDYRPGPSSMISVDCHPGYRRCKQETAWREISCPPYKEVDEKSDKTREEKDATSVEIRNPTSGHTPQEPRY